MIKKGVITFNILNTNVCDSIASLNISNAIKFQFFLRFFFVFNQYRIHKSIFIMRNGKKFVILCISGSGKNKLEKPFSSSKKDVQSKNSFYKSWIICLNQWINEKNCYQYTHQIQILTFYLLHTNNK